MKLSSETQALQDEMNTTINYYSSRRQLTREGYNKICKEYKKGFESLHKKYGIDINCSFAVMAKPLFARETDDDIGRALQHKPCLHAALF